MQEKKRIQTTDVCDTLLARDWKDPKCVPVEEDEIKVIGNYMPSNHDASRVVDVDGIAPTVKENHGTVTAIVEPQVVKVGQASTDGSQCGTVYSTDDLAPTLTAGCHGYAMGYIAEEQEPFIVASRGRNPENPSDRTTGAPTEQRLEPNFSGTTNCLTSVQKDNYVAEPVVDKVAIVEDQFPGSRDARIYKEYSPTLRQNCNGLKVANGEEETEINPKLVGGIGEKNFGKQYRQGNRVYDSDEIAMALNAQPVGNAGGYSYLYAVEEEQPRIRWRIRKLTPLECWRLMNFTDQDCNRAAKYVSASALYKQAGNSIVVACLIAIFSSLFIEDGYKSDIWTKYSLNYDG